jgi:hypothetical protein
MRLYRSHDIWTLDGGVAPQSNAIHIPCNILTDCTLFNPTNCTSSNK